MQTSRWLHNKPGKASQGHQRHKAVLLSLIRTVHVCSDARSLWNWQVATRSHSQYVPNNVTLMLQFRNPKLGSKKQHTRTSSQPAASNSPDNSPCSHADICSDTQFWVKQQVPLSKEQDLEMAVPSIEGESMPCVCDVAEQRLMSERPFPHEVHMPPYP